MTEDLRERCRRFVEKTPPPDLAYAGNSVAERILRMCAAGIAPDGELLDLLEIVVADSRETAEKLGGAAGAYLLESAALLEEIAGGT